MIKTRLLICFARLHIISLSLNCRPSSPNEDKRISSHIKPFYLVDIMAPLIKTDFLQHKRINKDLMFFSSETHKIASHKCHLRVHRL